MDLWRRIDQFEVTNYSWISISLNRIFLSHMDLSLTDFMIINSWHELSHSWQETAYCIWLWIYAVYWTWMVWSCDDYWLSDYENLLICPRFFVNRLFWSALVGVWCQIMLALRILLVNHFIYWNVNKDTIKFKNTITQELPEIKFKWKSFPDWIISALIFCRSVSSRLHFNAF